MLVPTGSLKKKKNPNAQLAKKHYTRISRGSDMDMSKVQSYPGNYHLQGRLTTIDLTKDTISTLLYPLVHKFSSVAATTFNLVRQLSSLDVLPTCKVKICKLHCFSFCLENGTTDFLTICQSVTPPFTPYPHCFSPTLFFPVLFRFKFRWQPSLLK